MQQAHTLTVQLPEESITRLDTVARNAASTKADIASLAIQQYLDLYDWETLQIQNAIKEADSAQAKFIDHDDVVQLMKNTGN